ncbi:MAG: hypothetical protein Q9O74_00015 [Planctomycetota bacterium]|nr:hypothetical protein [Planctomycetota bacterium]
MLTRIAAVLVLALSLLAVTGCEETVTPENYDLIQVDMDLIEVESIMGGAGELQVASGVGIGAAGMVESQGGGGDTKDYLWGDENQGILVMVKDGKVIYKQKFGLN